jgi:hypothetical protein
MANVKKGQLTAPPEWWKHLRWTKRVFWKAERRAGNEEAKREAETGGNSPGSAGNCVRC